MSEYWLQIKEIIASMNTKVRVNDVSEMDLYLSIKYLRETKKEKPKKYSDKIVNDLEMSLNNFAALYCSWLMQNDNELVEKIIDKRKPTKDDPSIIRYWFNEEKRRINN